MNRVVKDKPFYHLRMMKDEMLCYMLLYKLYNLTGRGR